MNRRACGFVLAAVGVIAIVAGALQLRDTDILADQVSYLVSSGIGGLALIMAGVTLVASAGARAEVHGRLTRIEATIRSTRGDGKL
ncbi:MAG: hypothetical protein AB1679_03980 [Actinomycetota bacterium]